MKARTMGCSVLLAAFAAFAAGACGNGGSSAIRPDDGAFGGSAGDGPQGGSRLQPLTFANSDGSKAAFGWMDTQLHRACTFDLIYGTTGACVPADLYSIPGDSFSNSLSTTDPTFYLDAACKDSTTKGIIANGTCLDYGLMKVTKSATAREYPGCSYSTGTSYYVLQPFDLSKQKAYRYGIPDGGGQCCSCNEIKSIPTSSKMFLYAPTSADNLGNIKLVTGTLNNPGLAP